MTQDKYAELFLYSQDLSNCTTPIDGEELSDLFLYSQDLSNCTTKANDTARAQGFCTLKI